MGFLSKHTIKQVRSKDMKNHGTISVKVKREESKLFFLKSKEINQERQIKWNLID